MGATIEIIASPEVMRVPIRGPLATLAATGDDELLMRCEIDLAGTPYRLGPAGGLVVWGSPAPAESWVPLADCRVGTRELEDSEGRMIDEGGQFGV